MIGQLSARDERTKLVSSALANCGVGTIVGGFLIPEYNLHGPSAQLSIYEPYIPFALGVMLILLGVYALGALGEPRDG